MDGASLARLMAGQADEPRLAYADALNTQDTFSPLERLPKTSRDDLLAVTDGRYKLIHHLKEPSQSELFDLQVDPDEQVNIYASAPEVAARLHDFLRKEGALTISVKGDTGQAPDGDALRGLGYTGD